MTAFTTDNTRVDAIRRAHDAAGERARKASDRHRRARERAYTADDNLRAQEGRVAARGRHELAVPQDVRDEHEAAHSELRAAADEAAACREEAEAWALVRSRLDADLGQGERYVGLGSGPVT